MSLISSQRTYETFFNIKLRTNNIKYMVSIRVCKSCGNIYNRTAGMKLVNSCPVCHSANKEQYEID